MNSLENYIKENLRKGIKLESIKKALSLAGYKREAVENAIKRIYREQITDIAKYINKEIKQGLHSSAVRNYLLALGHPKTQVDDAIEKIISAKKALLRKKKAEKTKEQFRAIIDNISAKFSKYLWYNLEPWQRGAYIPTIIVLSSWYAGR